MDNNNKIALMAAQQKILSAGRLLTDAYALIEGAKLPEFHDYPPSLPSFDELALAVHRIVLLKPESENDHGQ